MRFSSSAIPLFALTSNAINIPRHFFDSGPSVSPSWSHGRFYNSSTGGSSTLGSVTTSVSDDETTTSYVTVYETIGAGSNGFIIENPTGVYNSSSGFVVPSLAQSSSSLSTVYTSSISVAVTLSESDSESFTSTSATSATGISSPSLSTSASTPTSSTDYSGRGTYYEVSADACGTSSTDSDYVVAIAQSLYESLGTTDEYVSSACGKYITATYQGKSVQVKVVDACASCSDSDLDFSPTAFEQLAQLDVGEIEIEWSFD